MQETVVVSYARTPFGRLLGTLSSIPAVDLGGMVIKEVIKRAGIDGEIIDYVFMGMVVPAGMGQIPSRQATLKAGLSPEISSDTLNKVCAASLRTVNIADAFIKAGEYEVIVAGGMESMSRCPYLVPQGRAGYRMGNGVLVDSMVNDGLWCPVHDVHMGIHGEMAYTEFGITREEMDRWSLRSHQLVLKGYKEGKFKEEIMPVTVPQKKKDPIIFEMDECPRADTSYEVLSKLPPAFKKDGVITAGNAPPVNDGASALLLMSRKKAEELGLKPLARIVSQGQASKAPPYISTVPYYAAEKALQKAKLTIDDIDLIEVNEAFAAVSLTCMKLGNWPEEKVNVNGGAVAIGHPIGASGGRILMTLISELRRRKAKYGLATICSGAAQGEATIVEALY
ncbi:MAG: thiolase family protein [Dethiobacteria bacterium]|jgi:acetyl-CoA C-acetyltransferase